MGGASLGKGWPETHPSPENYVVYRDLQIREYLILHTLGQILGSATKCDTVDKIGSLEIQKRSMKVELGRNYLATV